MDEELERWLQENGAKYRADIDSAYTQSSSESDYYQRLRDLRDKHTLSNGEGWELAAGSLAKPAMEIAGGVARGAGWLADKVGADRVASGLRGVSEYTKERADRVRELRDQGGTVAKGLSFAGELVGSLPGGVGSASLVRGGSRAAARAAAGRIGALEAANTALQGGARSALGRVAAGTAQQLPQIVAQNAGAGRGFKDTLLDVGMDLGFGGAGELFTQARRAGAARRLRGEQEALGEAMSEGLPPRLSPEEMAAEESRKRVEEATQKLRARREAATNRRGFAEMDRRALQAEAMNRGEAAGARRDAFDAAVAERDATRQRVMGNVEESRRARGAASKAELENARTASVQKGGQLDEFRQAVREVFPELENELSGVSRLEDAAVVLRRLQDLNVNQVRELLGSREVYMRAKALSDVTGHALASKDIDARQAEEALARLLRVRPEDMADVRRMADELVEPMNRQELEATFGAAQRELGGEGYPTKKEVRTFEGRERRMPLQTEGPPPRSRTQPDVEPEEPNPFSTTAAASDKAPSATVTGTGVLKKEAGKAALGAGLGVTLGAPATLSAQGPGGEDEGDRLATLTAAAAGGALLALGGSWAWRAVANRGNPAARRAAREVLDAAKQEAKEADIRAKLADPATRQRVVDRLTAERGTLPLGPERLVDPYAPLPELGGKSARDYLNMDQFVGLSDESRARLAAEVVGQAQVTRGVPKTVEPLAHVTRDARRLSAARILEQVDPARSTRRENIAVASTLAGVSEDVEKLVAARTRLKNDLAATGDRNVSDVIKSKLKLVDGALLRLREDQSELANFLSRAGTEAGRDLRAHRLVVASMAHNPEAYLSRVADTLRRNLTGDEAGKLRDLLDARDFEGAAQYALDLQQRSGFGMLVDLINAGRLSGIAGRGRDLISGTTNTVVESAVNAPVRAFADRIIGKVANTGVRSADDANLGDIWSDLKDAVRGVEGTTDAKAEGMVEAMRRFWGEDVGVNAFREGGLAGWLERQRKIDIDADALYRLDLPRSTTIKNFTGNQAVDESLDALQKSIFRVTTGIDKVAKGGSYAARLAEEARLIAKQEVADGLLDAKELPKRVAELRVRPTQEMKDAAKLTAERNTFQNHEAMASLVTKIKRELPALIRKGPGGALLGDAVEETLNLVVPFARTGANIAGRVMDYTPFGLVRAGLLTYGLRDQVARGVLTTAQIRMAQRDAAEAVSRFATGSLLAAAGGGYSLYKRGVFSGSMPTDPSERAAWEAAGVRPNSMNIGGVWVPVGQYSPWGNALIVGANVARAMEDRSLNESKLSNIMSLLSQSTLQGGKTVLEQPLVTGLEGFMQAVQDPDRRLGAFASSQASSLVPTVVSDIAAISDKGRGRMVDKDDFVKYMGGSILRRIPGLNQKLPMDYDVLGRERQFRSGSPLSLVNPLSGNSSERLDLPDIQALLEARGGLSKPRRAEGESVREYSDRLRETGSGVREAIMSRIRGGGGVPRPRNAVEREALRAALQDVARGPQSRGRRRVAGSR